MLSDRTLIENCLMVSDAISPPADTLNQPVQVLVGLIGRRARKYIPQALGPQISLKSFCGEMFPKPECQRGNDVMRSHPLPMLDSFLVKRL
jgi:hypothetical protein